MLDPNVSVSSRVLYASYQKRRLTTSTVDIYGSNCRENSAVQVIGMKWLFGKRLMTGKRMMKDGL
jgi:hypothetical protein